MVISGKPYGGSSKEVADAMLRAQVSTGYSMSRPVRIP